MTLSEAPHDSLMTVEEMARYLRISRAKAYALTSSGDIPTVRMGRSVRIRRDRLHEWLDNQSRSS